MAPKEGAAVAVALGEGDEVVNVYVDVVKKTLGSRRREGGHQGDELILVGFGEDAQGCIINWRQGRVRKSIKGVGKERLGLRHGWWDGVCSVVTGEQVIQPGMISYISHSLGGGTEKRGALDVPHGDT
eukprot:1089787-Ditylum_brightwellii.AAC.1